MEPTLFKCIFRHSGPDQMRLVLLTAMAFPFLYLSLELPKTIVNDALADGNSFPASVAWLGLELERIPYLLALSFLFLGLVCINGVFKYTINVYSGVVGERMLRRLRYSLFQSILRFPLPHFRKVGQGEIVAMVVSETEPLAGFIGESVKLPVFQGGTLLTILGFMFVQDWVLGVAAIVLYPLQAYLIPRLQRRLNELRREIVMERRSLAEGVGEVVGSILEVHANDTSHYESALFTDRMERLYRIRLAIFKRKYLIKFINNFLAQVTPFFFFSIGGILVISGDLTFGALVAVLAAHKDLNAPWKELLHYYEQKEDARIKYELLYETFRPEGLLPAELQDEEPDPLPTLHGELAASRVDLRDSAAEGPASETVSFRLDTPRSVFVAGLSGGGAERLGAVMARLRTPAGGRISIGDLDLHALPESVTGRRIAYVGQESRLRSGTLRDNLLYVLHHRPRPRPCTSDEGPGESRQAQREARLTGNSPYRPDEQWIDLSGVGADRPADLTAMSIDAVSIADLDEDLYQLGLQGVIDPAVDATLAERLMQARAELRARLATPELEGLVEAFDGSRYNQNMTVAENLLFGTPRDAALDVENLADNAYVRRVLYETDLMPAFLSMGRELAALMVEMFAGVPADSELFAQFSFIGASDLPEFRNLLNRTAGADLGQASSADRRMLISLPFKLVPARHRVGLLDDEMISRILDARRVFAAGFGLGPPDVDFFDQAAYNPGGTIQDNVLFGRLTYGRGRGGQRVGAVIRDVIASLDLTRDIMEVGLNFNVGVGGSRLTAGQRQKVAIARALLKRPDLLILDHATVGLDGAAQARIRDRLLDADHWRTLIWVGGHATVAAHFDSVLVIEGGQVVEQGSFIALNRPGTALHALLGGD